MSSVVRSTKQKATFQKIGLAFSLSRNLNRTRDVVVVNKEDSPVSRDQRLNLPITRLDSVLPDGVALEGLLYTPRLFRDFIRLGDLYTVRFPRVSSVCAANRTVDCVLHAGGERADQHRKHTR
jgi:hypothetical protein